MKNLLLNLNPKSLEIVRSIGILAESQGMKAYLVGGPVRDLILKVSNVDLDITVEGDGMRLADLFKMELAAEITRYPAFKTATVRLKDGRQVDFATARSEVYVHGGAFPMVKPSGIKEDLCRRDFTINAMAVALNPKTWGKLMDPFKGILDLKARRLRILHDKSFQDDPTRILRAARFKERLGLRMEAKTLKHLKSAIKMKVLDTIKPQRYRKDFNKILKEPKAQAIVECLKLWDAYKE